MEMNDIVRRSMPIVLILILIFFLSVYFYPELGERLRTFSPLGLPLPSTEDFEGSYSKIETGNHLPFSTRQVGHRNFVFKLNPPENQKTNYYIRVQIISNIMLSI